MVLVVDIVQKSHVTTAQNFVPDDVPFEKFVPSFEEQVRLKRDFNFLVATSVISNRDQLSDLLGSKYPKHVFHKHSEHAGKKTQQVLIISVLS